MFENLKTRCEAIEYKLRTRSKILPLLIVFVNAFCEVGFRYYRFLAKRKAEPRDPKKILVIRADRIGDMILATPIFEPLKERYPKAKITCLASSLSSPLIEGNPYIDDIMVYDPPWFDPQKGHKFFRDYLHLWRTICARRFDMAIDLRGNCYNFFFLMFLTRISQRVSFDAALGAFLLTHPVPFEPGKHETDYFLDIVVALGGKPVEKPQPVLILLDKERMFAEGFFRANNITSEDVVIAIHPGAGVKRVYKRWPEDRYVKLCKLLVQEYDAKLIISGSQAEFDLADRIKNQIGEHAVLAAGAVKRLKDLAAVLQRCSVCIGTSTGIIHIAAAVGVPVIVLCGPEDPRRWRPLSNNHTLIKKDVPCRPCREETCHYEGRCLRLTTPEEVLAAVEAYVQ
jgi:lipopolysaccharide heptosyltransferase II